MKVFVVHKAIQSYDNEDKPTSTVIGVYSSRKAAEFGRLSQGGTITEITMDFLPASYKKWLDEPTY